MLVLSRKIGERILVDDVNIVVTIVSVKGNQVRVGISAPDDVVVCREEVWQQMVREGRRSRARR